MRRALLWLALAGCAKSSGPAATPEVAVTQALPTPYTAEQIRDHMPEGLVIVLEARQGEALLYQVRWEVLDTTTDRMQMSTQVTRADAPETKVTDTSGHAWEDLRQHAAFPPGSATRTRTSRDTELGRFEGWLYEVRRTTEDGEVEVSRFFFADATPGAPLWMETVVGNQAPVVTVQVSRTPSP